MYMLKYLACYHCYGVYRQPYPGKGRYAECGHCKAKINRFVLIQVIERSDARKAEDDFWAYYTIKEMIEAIEKGEIDDEPH